MRGESVSLERLPYLVPCILVWIDVLHVCSQPTAVTEATPITVASGPAVTLRTMLIVSIHPVRRVTPGPFSVVFSWKYFGKYF